MIVADEASPKPSVKRRVALDDDTYTDSLPMKRRAETTRSETRQGAYMTKIIFEIFVYHSVYFCHDVSRRIPFLLFLTTILPFNLSINTHTHTHIYTYTYIHTHTHTHTPTLTYLQIVFYHFFSIFF